MELPTSLLMATAGGGMAIPEWGWGLISIVLVALIGLIAYLLRRRDEELSRAIKVMDQKLEKLDEIWIEQATLLGKLQISVENVDKREPTVPTTFEEALRQLRETRIEHGGMIERQARELSAVERKVLAQIEIQGKDLRELKEKMWEHQMACQGQFVLKLDYQRQQTQVMEVLENLKTAAVKLEAASKQRKKS